MEKTLSSCSDSSHGRKIDLKDNDAITEIFKAEAKAIGKFNGIVHCCWIAFNSTLRRLNSDSYRKVMEINTFAAIELVENFVSKKVCTTGEQWY